MKRILIIFAIIAVVVSCYYDGERIPFGVVHLSVLKEDGTSFNDNEAERFVLQYVDKRYTKTKTVINQENALIFQCATEVMIYRKGDSINDDDVMRALDLGQGFIMKDTKGEYKTIKKIYKECYKSHEENPSPRRTYYVPDYIYHCEVKLERK